MKIDIERTARLARIKLTEEEKTTLTNDLEKIVAHVETLGKLDTEHVEPTSHVLNIENVYRDDVVITQDTAKAVLEALPEDCKEPPFFKVPKIIEDH